MITLNANINRKIPGKKQYSSAGYSCSITAEVDDSALKEPERLQEKLNYLYQQCGHAIESQIKAGAANERPAHPHNTNRLANHASSGDRGNNGNGYRRDNAQPMTDKQRSYIEDLAVNVNLDADGLNNLCLKMFNSTFAALSKLDASALLSTLKDVKSGALSLACL